MSKHRKQKKRLSTEDFSHVVDILLIDVKKPQVSFNDLSKKETTRINQKEKVIE